MSFKWKRNVSKKQCNTFPLLDSRLSIKERYLHYGELDLM